MAVPETPDRIKGSYEFQHLLEETRAGRNYFNFPVSPTGEEHIARLVAEIEDLLRKRQGAPELLAQLAFLSSFTAAAVTLGIDVVMLQVFLEQEVRKGEEAPGEEATAETEAAFSQPPSKEIRMESDS